MNKIYKPVWSKTKNMYVAVCEFVSLYVKSGKSKGRRCSVAAGVLACVLACGAYMPFAEAANDMVGTKVDNSDLFVVTDDSDMNLAVKGLQDVRDDSNLRVDKDLSVGGNSSFKNNVHLAKDLKVGGNANIDGTLAVDRIITGGKNVNREFDRLDGRIDQVGAKSAALSGLRPVDTDADQVVSIAASYGRFKGENAAALGLFYRPTDSVLVGVGGTVGSSDNMMNASVSFGLNKGKNYGMSKVAMAKELQALKKDNDDMKKVMLAMAQKLGNLSLVEGKRVGFPDVPKNHWANKAVETLHGNNMVKGYPDGLFKGDQKMSRYEYAEMLYNALSRGADIKKEHLREYAPELAKVRQQRQSLAVVPPVRKPLPSLTVGVDNSLKADLDMQSVGAAYNARFK